MKFSAVKLAYALIVLCGIAYAFFALQGPNGIPGLFEKRRQVREYEMANTQLQRTIEEKQERIKRLESDPAEQEMEIRQRLKFAKPGEQIYILDGTRGE
jgi:cell division protein FtsB